MPFFSHSVNLLRTIARDKEVAVPRSPLWHEVEKKHLASNGKCAACSATRWLNVHHILPFHIHPEFELVPSNLVTLCMGINDCHVLIGHGDDFKAYNPMVLAHVLEVSSGSKTVQEVAVLARQARIYGAGSGS